jgi:SHS2 domain-containing protein
MDSHERNFTIIEHTADLGLRVRGKTLERLFENAAEAMINVMVKAPALQSTETVPVRLEGRDPEDLLVRWLAEVLYWFEGEKQVTVHAHVISLSPGHLEANLDTVPFDPDTHEILCEIKAVTYHQVQIARTHDDVWEGNVIFDV